MRSVRKTESALRHIVGSDARCDIRDEIQMTDLGLDGVEEARGRKSPLAER
jgi:hypothetical protein